MLDNETLAEIDRISRFPFLEQVEQPYSGPYVAIKTWAKAEEKWSSARWLDFTMACSNRSVAPRNRARAAGVKIDEARDEMLARTKPARDKIALIVAANTRTLSLPASASILLFDAIMEFYFRREVEPIFFHPIILPIFEEGRLPCGCNTGFLPLKIRQGDFNKLPDCKFYIL